MRTDKALVVVVACILVVMLPATQASAGSYTEQEGSRGANTFTDYHNASGIGPRLGANQSVTVSCKVHDPYIASVNPDGYWYRIATSPWNDQYYAAANTFWNGDVPGHLPYTHNTDWGIPDCGPPPAPSPPPPTPTPTPSVSLAKGPAATVGYWYSISLTNYPASAPVSVTCYDSVSSQGFRTFSLDTDSSGSASTQSECLSADGPDHWVIAGHSESQHVEWTAPVGEIQTPEPAPTPPVGAPVQGGSAPRPQVETETCDSFSGVPIANGHSVATELLEHYQSGHGAPVVIDWSFFSSRPDFAQWATTTLSEHESGQYPTPKSDVDMYLSLRTFTATRTTAHCYSVLDTYDFFPTDLLRAEADGSFNPEKALTDLLTLPAWADQLLGARQFTIHASGKL